MSNAAAFSGGYVANLGPSEEGFLMPAVDEEGRFFWEGTLAGELRIQVCESCGRLRHPPRPMCPSCRSTDAGLEAGGGQGDDLVLRGPPPAAACRRIPSLAPYNVIVVALDEHPTIRFVGNLVSGPEGALNEIDPDFDPHRRAGRGGLQALPSRRRQRRGPALLGARQPTGSRPRHGRHEHAADGGVGGGLGGEQCALGQLGHGLETLGVLGEEPLDGLVVGRPVQVARVGRPPRRRSRRWPGR